MFLSILQEGAQTKILQKQVENALTWPNIAEKAHTLNILNGTLTKY